MDRAPAMGRRDRLFSARNRMVARSKGTRLPQPRRRRHGSMAGSRSIRAVHRACPGCAAHGAALSQYRFLAAVLLEETSIMVKFKWVAAGLIGLSLAGASLAQQGPVTIVGLMELSGTGATAGTNFDNGVKLAVKEINAAGGILGRKIEYTSMDTQTNPGVAKALAQKAVDQGAYVVMGPVFSGSIIVSMVETKRAEVPNFTGGEAANITQQGNPYVFRTSFTQSTAMPKVAKYIKDGVKAKSVAMIWVNNDFGKGGHDSMQKALDAQGIKVVADVPTDPGQVDFSGVVLKAKQSNADALFG